jgi:hypothetical protein
VEVEWLWLHVMSKRMLVSLLMLLQVLLLVSLLVLSLMLIVPLMSRIRLLHSGPSLQNLTIVQPRPYSTHHLLDLIDRKRVGSSPCAKLTSSVFARLRVHQLFGCWIP